MTTTINDQLNEILRSTEFGSPAFERAFCPVMEQIREALQQDGVPTWRCGYNYPGVYRMIGPVELLDEDIVIEDTLKYGSTGRYIAKRIPENIRNYFYYLEPYMVKVRGVYIQERRMRLLIEQCLRRRENVLREFLGLPKLY